MKLVTRCPSNSEILFASGAGDQVVAVDRWTDYPPGAARLPSVGSEIDVDIDAVADCRPDLVLASLSVPGMEKNVAALEARRIPHMVLDPHSISDIHDDILRVGEAVGRSEEAIRLVRSMEEEIAGIARINRDRPTPARIYIEWWPDPAVTPGGRCWTKEMIALAGGENIFAHIPAASISVRYADVVEKNPEIILLCWCGIHRSAIDPASIESREGWSRINAVGRKAIHIVDEGWYGRPGPRIVEGIRQMADFVAAT